jgi:hypothetical protein
VRNKIIALRGFENSLLRLIFGANIEEVIGQFRKLHNEELYNLCFSSNIIRFIESGNAK